MDLNILETPRYWKFNAPPFIASIAKITSQYKIDVGTPSILFTFHQAGKRDIPEKERSLHKHTIK